jgi:glycosyltransferase involved in cell wall biosynthesis
LRIVQAVGWYLPDSLGGTELYVAALGEELKRAGHEVLVAAPHVGEGERRYTHHGVQVYRYPIPASPTRAEARGEVVAPGAELFHHWLRTVRPDIVHFHTFVTGLGLHELDAARAAGAKVIVTSHAASLGFLCARGTLMHMGTMLCDGRIDAVKCAACALQHRHMPRAAATILSHVPRRLSLLATHATGRAGTTLGMRSLIERNQTAQKRLFDSTSAFVVLSDFAASVVRANGAPANKIVVNRLGVDVARGPWTPKPGPDERETEPPVTFGFVGRAEAIKGLEDLVRAAVSVPPTVPMQVRIVAAASSPEEVALVERCRAMSAHDTRISFSEPLLPRGVPRFLSEIDVLVSPSRAVEGGPTAALEAHAVGTPVIGTTMPALTEYVQHGTTGVLVPPGDWEALATHMEAIARNPAGTVDRWRAALVRPRTFDDIAREYLALYRAA